MILWLLSFWKGERLDPAAVNILQQIIELGSESHDATAVASVVTMAPGTVTVVKQVRALFFSRPFNFHIFTFNFHIFIVKWVLLCKGQILNDYPRHTEFFLIYHWVLWVRVFTCLHMYMFVHIYIYLYV